MIDWKEIDFGMLKEIPTDVFLLFSTKNKHIFQGKFNIKRLRVIDIPLVSTGMVIYDFKYYAIINYPE